MSVIEDALRRAEMQGRSTPPQSVAQITGAATAAAVVHRPMLTPSTGASAHFTSASPNSSRVQTHSATPKPACARVARPTVATRARKRYVGTLLIAAGLSLVFGQLFLDALSENPPPPAVIGAGGVGAPRAKVTPHPIAIEFYAPDSSTAVARADAPNDPQANPTVHRRVPIDTTDPAPPKRTNNPAPINTRPPIDPVGQSVASAALIESINQRFHVAGVMVSTGKRLAVINDVVVGLGDRVDGAIVRAVDARGAVIEVDGIRHHLPVAARGRNENNSPNSNQ